MENNTLSESVEEVTSSENVEGGCCDDHKEVAQNLDNKKKRGRPPKKIKKASETAVTKNKKEHKEKPKESKSKRKADALKPQFVNGTPVNPFQNEPAVANPYGYDPLSEVMELGKGQLQSAYRNTKNNIAPPKDKKMYKLEHKQDGEDGDTPNAFVPLYGAPLEEGAGDTGARDD